MVHHDGTGVKPKAKMVGVPYTEKPLMPEWGTPVVRESKVECRCCEYAQGRGWWVSKFTAPGKKAVPDRVFIRNGVVLFVEFKRPGEEPTLQQRNRHR